jgi:hypothetical protein
MRFEPEGGERREERGEKREERKEERGEVLLRNSARLSSKPPFVCFLYFELSAHYQVIRLSLIAKSLIAKSHPDKRLGVWGMDNIGLPAYLPAANPSAKKASPYKQTLFSRGRDDYVFTVMLFAAVAASLSSFLFPNS